MLSHQLAWRKTHCFSSCSPKINVPGGHFLWIYQQKELSTILRIANRNLVLMNVSPPKLLSFWPPWNYQLVAARVSPSWKNIFGYSWKNPLLPPWKKNPPGAHACEHMKHVNLISKIKSNCKILSLNSKHYKQQCPYCVTQKAICLKFGSLTSVASWSILSPYRPIFRTLPRGSSYLTD